MKSFGVLVVGVFLLGGVTALREGITSGGPLTHGQLTRRPHAGEFIEAALDIGDHRGGAVVAGGLPSHRGVDLG